MKRELPKSIVVGAIALMAIALGGIGLACSGSSGGDHSNEVIQPKPWSPGGGFKPSAPKGASEPAAPSSGRSSSS